MDMFYFLAWIFAPLSSLIFLLQLKEVVRLSRLGFRARLPLMPFITAIVTWAYIILN